jgi:hypothetical protein
MQMPTRFLWDHRPGHNVDHITAHGLTTDLWEAVFHRATRRIPDKDDAEVTAAEGRVGGRLYRIVYACDDEVVLPLTILPITGFPIRRRGLR